MLPETDQPSPAQMRARIARASKAGDAAELATAREEYRLHQLEDHIRRLVDEAPPLTNEQRDRLRTLLSVDAAPTK